MKNLLREKLSNGKQVFGTFFSSGACDTVEMLGLAGMDFIIFDKEHGPYGVETVLNLMRAAELRGTTPLVRVKDATRPSIMKVMDIGAHGIIIPNITDVESVGNVVKYSKYYPVGRRGIFFPRASDYGDNGDLLSYMAETNAETLILPQCETKECLENISAILAVDGVDGIFIGPYDLSQGLDIPGQFDNPIMINAMKTILEACRVAGKYAFTFVGNPQQAKQRFEQGFDGATIGLDGFILSMFKDLVKRAK